MADMKDPFPNPDALPIPFVGRVLFPAGGRRAVLPSLGRSAGLVWCAYRHVTDEARQTRRTPATAHHLPLPRRDANERRRAAAFCLVRGSIAKGGVT